jgi:hypothetical protein
MIRSSAMMLRDNNKISVQIYEKSGKRFNIKEYQRIIGIFGFIVILCVLWWRSDNNGESGGNVIKVKISANDDVPLDSKVFRNLVIVPCHSVFIGDAGKFKDDESWALESFQKGKFVGLTFIDHMKVAVEECDKDLQCLLIYSGGQTRFKAGPQSEGFSYWRVSEELNWFGHRGVRKRAFVEEFARDSFENLIFSIARFRELTGIYPHNISVVGYEFKKDRFVNLHRKALGFPEERFSYIGRQDIVGEPYSKEILDKMSEGEHLNAVKHFTDDPYGCHSQVLQDKRKRRDPFVRSPPYVHTCPEISDLLKYCGPSLYSRSLPWK